MATAWAFLQLLPDVAHRQCALAAQANVLYNPVQTLQRNDKRTGGVCSGILALQHLNGEVLMRARTIEMAP